MTDPPLRRNRDFVLLQLGQLVSATGTQAVAVAYSLLVLAISGSAALAGAVGFMRLLPSVLFALLAGVAADRHRRKLLMIAADLVRAVAVGSLAVAIVLGRPSVLHILVVAFTEGACSSFFRPAAMAALRMVVPAGQLPSAVATQQARAAIASLAGPSAGGMLFTLGRAVPFVFDTLSYLVSAGLLVWIRQPLEEERPPSRSRVYAQMVEGWRFLWQQPFLRTTTFLYGLTNIIGPGMLLALVVVGEAQGVSGTVIGVLLAAFSAFLLVGSVVSGAVRRLLPPRGVMLLELWAWPALVLFIVWPNVYVLAACLLPAALAIPVTDSVVIGYRLAITPEAMIGRVESVRSTIALSLAPLGTLMAGVLLSATSPRVAMLGFVGLAVLLVFWGTMSPAIRRPPELDQVDGEAKKQSLC